MTLIIELYSDRDLQTIDRKVFDSRFSMNINFIFIVKSDSLKDLEIKLYHRFDGFRSNIVRYVNDFNDVNVTYIRPVINGCHSYNGIYYSNEPNLTAMMTSTTCNLNGTHLRVAANIDLPYCDLELKDGVFIFKDSVESKMINVLAKRFNFVIDIVYANQSWGTVQNGVWTGSVGHLYNKTADIAICDLSRNSDRLKVVDFTTAYITIPLTFVTNKPGLKSRTWITIEPFSFGVWLTMFVSFIVTTVFIQLLNSALVSADKQHDSISIYLLAALLQQSDVRISSNHFSIRFYFGLWFLTSLILMKTYSGIFFSVLTVPQYEDPIETLDDLERAAKSGEYEIVTTPNTAYYDLFTKAECCGAYYEIGEVIKGVDMRLPQNTKDGIEMMNEAAQQHNKLIFIYTYVSIFFSVRTYATAEMHISSETLMMDQMAMALQKGSPLLHSMNKAIEQFVENGLFHNWLSETLHTIPAKSHFGERDTSEANVIKNLRLRDLKSIFFICMFGLIFTILVLICEMIYFMRKTGLCLNDYLSQPLTGSIIYNQKTLLLSEKVN